MSESIGMMDRAYFVGKVVILQWFNELLDVSTFFCTWWEYNCSCCVASTG